VVVLGSFTDKLRAFAHDTLQAGANSQRPAVRRTLDFVSTVNDLLGKPLRPTEEAAVAPSGNVAVAPTGPVQLPVIVYFDGKDHRTKTKVEELLRGRDLAFKVLDVSNDESERSWVITAAKSEEFPIVVIAGTPVGGLAELTQLDVTGELKRRAFGLQQ
jgi:glutaredoxin